jgi:Protein of Unknown function (DUF2784)
MLARFLADVVVVAHLAFIAFVLFGGLLALRWPRAAWVHLPCAVYGAAIEVWGWVCPLTPLENALRRRGGEAGYTGAFVEHYVRPVLYPLLPRSVFSALAVVVVLVNVAVYAAVLARRRRRTSPGR